MGHGMSIEWDTIISFLGLGIFLAGIYLLLGLPVMLILLGAILVYVGVKFPTKVEKNEPDQTTNTNVY